MKLAAYDKETDKWIEGELISIHMKCPDGESRYFYNDNVRILQEECINRNVLPNTGKNKMRPFSKRLAYLVSRGFQFAVVIMLTVLSPAIWLITGSWPVDPFIRWSDEITDSFFK